MFLTSVNGGKDPLVLTEQGYLSFPRQECRVSVATSSSLSPATTRQYKEWPLITTVSIMGVN